VHFNPIKTELRSWMLTRCYALLMASCLFAASAFANAATLQSAVAQPDPSAQNCLDNLRHQALANGYAEPLVSQVFARIQIKPKVIASDRAQAEFVQTFSQYYAKRVTPQRVEQGRNLLVTHQVLLNDIQRDTGIPPQYILALWGLETNFGGYLGNLHTPSALATLACDARRSAFFTREFMAALAILAAGDIAPDDLIGSWAGAIGHMQFMPTTFLAHAVDADQDGRRDVLRSLPDAFYSGAAYLQSLGWDSGFRWGREVHLPANFDYANSGAKNSKPLSEWSVAGVTDTQDHALPKLSLAAAILLPMGHTGPAFLSYANFNIIKAWNRSESYALTVVRLADRIAGAGKLSRPLPDVQLGINEIKALQSSLTQLGYDPGPADGLIGPGTRGAVRAYQVSHNLIADGFPSQDLISQVRNAVKYQPQQVPAKTHQ